MPDESSDRTMVAFRCSRQQHKLITQHAKAYDMTTTDYIINACLDLLPETKADITNRVIILEQRLDRLEDVAYEVSAPLE